MSALAAAEEGFYGHLAHIEPIYVMYAALFLMAIVPIIVGAYASVRAQHERKDETESISARDAYYFPVIGSCVLFGLYLVFRFFSKEYINILLTAYFGLFGAAALFKMLDEEVRRFLFSDACSRKARENGFVVSVKRHGVGE